MLSTTIVPIFKKLNITFETASLLADMNNIDTVGWLEHINKDAYSGNWDVLPLRCNKQHVDAHPILQGFSFEAVEEWKNLPILDQCPAFHTVLKTLESHQCKIHSMRLMRLHAGAEISEHRDFGLGYDDGEVRLHVPITTNPQVEFLVNRELVPMQVGEMWYINADLPHSVANRGNTDRIHLVIDGSVNEWLHAQLSSDK